MTFSAQTLPVISPVLLREVILWLGDRYAHTLPEDQLEQALVESIHHPMTAQQPLEALRYLAGVVGLELSARHLSFKEALKYLQRDTPLLLLCNPVPDQQILIALTDFRWFHFQITVFSGYGPITRWIPWRELKKLLGTASFTDHLYCLLCLQLSFWGEASANTHHHRSPHQHLWRLLKLEWIDMSVIVIYSIITGLFSLVIPISIQALVNNVAFGSLLQPILVLTLLVFGTLLFLTLLRSLRLSIIEILQQRLFIRVATDLSERLLKVQLPFFTARHHGPEFLNRFFDVVTLQKSSALLLTDGLAIVLQILTGVFLLAFYHPLLLWFAILLMIAILIVVFILGIGGESSAIKESKMKYAVVAWLEEMSSHQTPFRNHSGHQYARQRTDQILRNYLKARKKHFKVIQRQYIGTWLLQALVSSTLLGIGGWLVIERQLSIGQLVAAELVVTGLLDSFSKFGKQLETYYDMLAALDKLGHLFSVPIEAHPPGLLLPDPKGMHVRLQHVSVNPSKEGGPILRDVCLEILPGTKIGILGARSWSSKALCDLLYGGIYPDQGWVELDGRDLRQIMPINLRSQVLLVRDLDIFTGSIEENLRLGQLTLTHDQIYASLQAVGLGERVKQLPQGLNTLLSQSGYPLSIEESHRLMIARALLQKPRLLILDGFLDLLDWKSQGPLAQLLFSQHAEMSVLILSSKLELLQHCDQNYILNTHGYLESLPTIPTQEEA